MANVDVVVTIQFSMEVKDQDEADHLYDNLMEKYFTGSKNSIPHLIVFLSQKLVEGAEADIEEISMAYNLTPLCSCPPKTPLGYHLEGCFKFKEPKV